jgi:hypothetical protein
VSNILQTPPAFHIRSLPIISNGFLATINIAHAPHELLTATCANRVTLNAGLSVMDQGQMATKAVNPLSPSFEQARGTKLPAAFGLGLGAMVSLGLWAGIFMGVKALLH